MTAHCVVIGSGAAGVAAAVALTARGARVTIVDAGLGADDDSAQAKAALAAVEPPEWRAADIARATRSSANAFKLHFGSDFVHRAPPNAPSFTAPETSFYRSFATGGLTRIWGAAVLPYPRAELDEWPVSADALAPHYRAVLDFVPHTSNADDLADVLEDYPSSGAPLELSGQMQTLWNQLQHARAALRDAGLTVGHARLAVDHRPREAAGCRYCGMCMYGCPYDRIYGAAATLESLRRLPLVEYRPGILVDRLAMAGETVTLRGRHIVDATPVELHCDRVFVATGVFETARIMLHSLDVPGHELTVRHSDCFELPLLRWRRARDSMHAPAHHLAQIFVELDDAALSTRMIHLQLYGYNALYDRELARRLGPLSHYFRGMQRALLERLVLAFGYLHSDVSSRLYARLGTDGGLHVRGEPAPAATVAARRVLRRLRRLGRAFGAWPLGVRVGLPGYGNHSGGSFPMSRRPGRFDSDELGRVPGLPRVHLVDASVLPSLSATTITLTVMANAHRIASTCEV